MSVVVPSHPDPASADSDSEASAKGEGKDPLGRESAERGWTERLEDALQAGGALLGTRIAILREEWAAKTRQLGLAAAGFGVALAFSLLALVVFTAFLAALFANLFGSALLGILAVFLIYAAVAAGAGYFGWKAFSRVRIGDFPVTQEEVRKDWEALRAARKAEEQDESEPQDADLESRFREGSE